MNIANKLTLFRIILVPVYIAFFYIPIPYWNYYALFIFIIAALTDLFDGKIARKRGIVTNFGKLIDPIADKLLVCSTLIMMTAFGWVNEILVIIMVGREFVISGLRLIAAAEGKVLAADMFGKAKTVVQIVAIITVMLQAGVFVGTFLEQWLITGGFVFMCIATVLSVLSCISYFVKNKDILKELV